MGETTNNPEDMGIYKCSTHIPSPYYKLLKNILKRKTIWITFLLAKCFRELVAETSYNLTHVCC